MNVSTILEKFESVEITNESRISVGELAFCTTQQALYEKVLAQHRDAFAILQKLKMDCENFMKSVSDDNDYDNYGHIINRYSCDYGIISKEDFAKKTIGTVHCNFISTILGYFTKKYNVSINSPEYEQLLCLKEPEKTVNSYYGFRGLTDEEKAKLKAETQAYEKAMESHLDSIINAKIDYNSILDHIFWKLDGSTFAERLEQEIMTASRNASRTRGRNPKYEIKNKKITMAILYPRKGYRDEYEVELNGEDYRAILRALTYFDSDGHVSSIYSGWDRLVCYRMYASEGIFDAHEVSGTKIHSFKYFKNGKFEISFDSHTAAQKFATDFLFINGVSVDE